MPKAQTLLRGALLPLILIAAFISRFIMAVTIFSSTIEQSFLPSLSRETVNHSTTFGLKIMTGACPKLLSIISPWHGYSLSDPKVTWAGNKAISSLVLFLTTKLIVNLSGSELSKSANPTDNLGFTWKSCNSNCAKEYTIPIPNSVVDIIRIRDHTNSHICRTTAFDTRNLFLSIDFDTRR